MRLERSGSAIFLVALSRNTAIVDPFQMTATNVVPLVANPKSKAEIGSPSSLLHTNILRIMIIVAARKAAITRTRSQTLRSNIRNSVVFCDLVICRPPALERDSVGDFALGISRSRRRYIHV